MKNILIQAHRWVRLSIWLLKSNIRLSLFLGMVYLSLYILPGVANLQFLMPITILAWPIVAAVYVNAYKKISLNKPFLFRDIFKIPRKSIRTLLALGVICFAYTIFMSLVLGDSFQSVMLLSQEPAGTAYLAKELGVMLIQIILLSIPLLMATWFSPLLIIYNEFTLFKAIKSSLAGSLLFIFPIVLAWFILLSCFLSIIFISMLLLMQGSQVISFFANLLFIISLTGYISTLFAFQYVTYKDIFKSLTIK